MGHDSSSDMGLMKWAVVSRPSFLANDRQE